MCPQMLNETKDTDLTCLHVPGSGLSLSDSARGVSIINIIMLAKVCVPASLLPTR